MRKLPSFFTGLDEHSRKVLVGFATAVSWIFLVLGAALFAVSFVVEGSGWARMFGLWSVLTAGATLAVTRFGKARLGLFLFAYLFLLMWFFYFTGSRGRELSTLYGVFSLLGIGFVLFYFAVFVGKIQLTTAGFLVGLALWFFPFRLSSGMDQWVLLVVLELALVFYVLLLVGLNYLLASFMQRVNQQQIKQQQLTLELQQSLAEKDRILRELHHRVKNNLQIISSIISLQILKAKSPAASEAASMIRGRVEVMSLLHEMLFSEQDIDSIPMHDYIRSLVSRIFQTLACGQILGDVDLELEEIHLEINRAMSCGLILFELITNSLRHNHYRPGTRVKVSLTQLEGDGYELKVIDNGGGFEESFVQENQGVGLLLVEAMVKQLRGSMRFPRQETGGCVEVQFPLAATG